MLFENLTVPQFIQVEINASTKQIATLYPSIYSCKFISLFTLLRRLYQRIKSTLIPFFVSLMNGSVGTHSQTALTSFFSFYHLSSHCCSTKKNANVQQAVKLKYFFGCVALYVYSLPYMGSFQYTQYKIHTCILDKCRNHLSY